MAAFRSSLRWAATAATALVACTHALPPARSTPTAPPNLIRLTDRIVSAGQPNAAWLQTLREQGFDAVIYLAPPTVNDAVHEEARIVGAQGLIFVNVPIDFRRPTEQDFDAFAALMSALAGRKVLVHCQVNMRAATMLFLYRVIHLRADPEDAYAQVTRVWTPNAEWMELVRAQLRKHRINYDPM